MTLKDLKKDDHVLLITRGYSMSDITLRRGFVEKVTKTRIKVRVRRSAVGADFYIVEFTMDGNKYPRERGYGSNTTCEPMTEDNRKAYNLHNIRLHVKNQIYRLSDEARGVTRNLDKLSLDQLNLIHKSLLDISNVVSEVKEEE